ncbi:MAG: ribokinase [Clostridia bacterium]|nr:ribokinase [Clostridia bacterium]
MAKILNFGSLNVDYVYHMDHFVLPGETLTSSARDVNCGGKGLNQSIAAASSGATVFHAGKIGRDGTMLTDMLNARGVDTSLVEISGGPSGHAIIQVDKTGQNSIILFPGANREIDSSSIERALENFEEGDYLILQNEISRIPEIMKAGASKGMKIVFNPSPVTDDIASFPLELADIFVLNEIEGEVLSGEKEPHEIIRVLRSKYPGALVLLTLGKNGSILAGKDVFLTYGIHSAPVVDTTAAGDTMLGFFTGLLASGIGYEEALSTATKAAAVTVSRKGAAPSIPTLEEARACTFPYVESGYGK